MRTAKTGMNQVGDLFCPRYCIFCESAIQNSEETIFFCQDCRDQFVVAERKFCPRCGCIGLESQRNRQDGRCPKCRELDFAFSQTVVLGEYGEHLRQAILQMKTEKQGYLAVSMARLFESERREQILRLDADIVVPVPMHFLRRFHRGVNSASFFATELAENFGMKLKTTWIKRTRYTKPQFKLNPTERRRNVRGAFAFSGSKHQIAGKKILLVDDIMTTGATCHEIATVLRQAGAADVYVAVFARAEGKKL